MRIVRWALLLAVVAWWCLGNLALMPLRERGRVRLPGADSLELDGPRGVLRGWAVGDPAAPHAACAVVLNGGSDRHALWRRLPEWRELGFVVVVVDLSGHGHSDGWTQGAGLAERRDVVAIADALRSRGCEGGLVLHGFATAAAAIALASDAHGADLVVLESMPATASEALHRDLQAGDGLAGRVLHGLVYPQLRMRFGEVDGCARCAQDGWDGPTVSWGQGGSKRVDAATWRAAVHAALDGAGLPKDPEPTSSFLADEAEALVGACRALLAEDVFEDRAWGARWTWTASSRTALARTRRLRIRSATLETASFTFADLQTTSFTYGCWLRWNAESWARVVRAEADDHAPCETAADLGSWRVERCVQREVPTSILSTFDCAD
jgi:hypothetical protein